VLDASPCASTIVFPSYPFPKLPKGQGNARLDIFGGGPEIIVLFPFRSQIRPWTVSVLPHSHRRFDSLLATIPCFTLVSGGTCRSPWLSHAAEPIIQKPGNRTCFLLLSPPRRAPPVTLSNSSSAQVRCRVLASDFFSLKIADPFPISSSEIVMAFSWLGFSTTAAIADLRRFFCPPFDFFSS